MNRNTDGQSQTGQGGEKLDNRVIPVMREAVATVQLILFRELKTVLAGKYAAWDGHEYARLIGCIVNDVFGTPATDKEAARFARCRMDAVEEEMRGLAANVPDLLPCLTDALRMQTFCDYEEGVNSLPTLMRARALGFLQEERAMPMPSTFMLAVRRLGVEYGLLEESGPKGPDAG
ncbi:MAG TPA: hypothetical protein ENN06_07000 [Desulfobacteraceae bacterium]|nr:hypothetical protein [Desulfobacteraceae bacterium]